MFKKILGITLAILTILAFTACSDNSQPEGTLSAAAKEEIKKAGLPEYDFKGYEFHILSVGRGTVCTDDFAYEEESSATLDQAIYERNKSVEALYNVKFVTEWKNTTANQQSPEGYRTLATAASSATTSYDLCVIPGYDVSQLASEGHLTDVTTLPHFASEAPWYDQKAVETFTFGDSLFFVAGDYGINLMDQTYCIAFNKKLADNYGVEDLYGLVRDKKWTLEKMYEISKKVATDSDGDGISDIYGNLYWIDAMYGALNAADRRLVTLDEKTLNFELSPNDQTMNDVVSNFYEMVKDEKTSLLYTHNSKNKEYVNIFSGDQALFFLTTIGTLSDFRDMETDYGILPYFLFSENQENYHNTVAPFYMNFMCVPLVVEDYTRTSAIMEAIGYFSEKYIVPAYYDKTLTGKYVRDAESDAMLDIIFDTRAYDIGYCYQPAHINKHLLYMLNDSTNDWNVRYEKYAISAQNTLNMISDKYRSTIGK